MAKSAFMFSEEGFEHKVPMGHPECPERLSAIQDGFKQHDLNPPMIKPKSAVREDLLRVHTREHVDLVEKCCLQNVPHHDPDTHMMKGSWEAALQGAGGAIEACRQVVEKNFENVFVATRPPGHHAEPNRIMGFCLFNNVAIAAKWLQDSAGLERVAILDWDVHHGNGTQRAFYDDPSVYYVSLHQSPLYPGTGHASEIGANDTNLNFPMPPNSPATDWLDTIEKHVVPTLEDFKPEFLLISCGFDAHKNDPLGQQNLDAADYAEMTRMVKALARGNIVSVLEGGYDFDALRESSVAHYNALKE